ncbi:MAG: ABC transporter ATP-binding protein [Candidatus Promineifilaceae bacterium]
MSVKPLLELKNINMVFGGLAALTNVNTRVMPGQIKAIIGPNGAGKTTLFNIISGIYTPTAGEVILNGEVINGLAPNVVSGKGITRTFQTIRLFQGMTVLENVMVGQHRQTKAGIIAAALRLPSAQREEKQIRQKASTLLEMAGLADRAHEIATELPFGIQRRVEITRALATEPSLILLDEPAAGLNESEGHELMTFVRTIRDQGITVMLVEHDMDVVMGLVDELLVLEYGRPIADADPVSVQQNPDVIRAYLGDE